MFDCLGPPFLSNVTARSSDFQTDVFVIILSWDSQNADTFTVSTNLTAQQGDPVYINLTTHRLEATYNTLLLITITAVNCAGTNERAATLMEGMYIHKLRLSPSFTHILLNLGIL